MQNEMRDKLIKAFDDWGLNQYIPFHTEREMLADHLIAHGVTGQDVPDTNVVKWISVDERLPEDIDTYLVVVKYKYDFEKDFSYATDVATYNPYENAYIDDCWCTFNDWDEGQQYLHITHWMPLPEPPKGE